MGYGSKTYYGYAMSSYGNGNYYNTGVASIDIPYPQPVSPSPPNISIESTGATPSIWIRVNRTAESGASISTYMGTNNVTFYTVSDYCSQFGASYTSNGALLTISDLQGETTYYFKAKAFRDGLESKWSATVSQKTGIGRPPNFSWSTTIASDSPFNIKADDWNKFRNYINTMRRYKSLSLYSFPSAPSIGSNFTYSEFNAVRNALYDLRSYMTGSYTNGALMPATVSSGSTIYASYFTNLSASYNSIS